MPHRHSDAAGNLSAFFRLSAQRLRIEVVRITTGRNFKKKKKAPQKQGFSVNDQG